MRIWDDAGFRANPGYALAGEVIEIGQGVNAFHVGDRVITLRNHASLMLASTDPWDTLKIPDRVSYEDGDLLAARQRGAARTASRPAHPGRERWSFSAQASSA